LLCFYGELDFYDAILYKSTHFFLRNKKNLALMKIGMLFYKISCLIDDSKKRYPDNKVREYICVGL